MIEGEAGRLGAVGVGVNAGTAARQISQCRGHPLPGNDFAKLRPLLSSRQLPHGIDEARRIALARLADYRVEKRSVARGWQPRSCPLERPRRDRNLPKSSRCFPRHGPLRRWRRGPPRAWPRAQASPRPVRPEPRPRSSRGRTCLASPPPGVPPSATHHLSIQ